MRFGQFASLWIFVCRELSFYALFRSFFVLVVVELFLWILLTGVLGFGFGFWVCVLPSFLVSFLCLVWLFKLTFC